MNKRIPKKLKDKIHDEIANSVYAYGPKHKCIEIRDKYVPEFVGSSTFYRWMREVKVASPTKKMINRARKDKKKRKHSGEATECDGQVKIGTLATQGFSGIDQYAELQKTLANVDLWSQEIVKKFEFDKDRTGKVSDLDIEEIIAGVSAIARMETVRVNAVKASAQIFVQLMDHDRLVEFNRRWFEIINEISPDTALRIAHESKEMLGEWGSIPL